MKTLIINFLINTFLKYYGQILCCAVLYCHYRHTGMEVLC